MLDKSKMRFPIRRTICVELPNGKLRYHHSCFIQELDDGSIVLHGKQGEITYTRAEYRDWFLDDIQVEEPDNVITWRLNLEKSKLPPHLKLVSRMMSITEVEPNKFRDSVYDLDAAGKSWLGHEPVRRFDGQEHAIPELGPGYTEVCEKIDTATDRITRKKDGEVIRRITNRISPDGLTFIAVEEGVSSDGQRYEAVFVYDRE